MNTTQDKLTIAEAAQVYGQLFGVGVTPATVWSWTRRGVNGVRLAYSRAGRRLYTTEADLRAFYDALMARDTEQARRRAGK